MKIYVSTPELKIPILLHIPNALAFTRLSAHLLSHSLNNQVLTISENELYVIFQKIKTCLQEYGHFNMIHVEENNDTIVDINF